MSDSIEAQVARGAALLDEKLPGWDQRIDLDNLDLGNKCNCVLGQEFDDDDAVGPLEFGYDAGLRELFAGDDDKAVDHGFLAADYEPHDQLTAEWRRVILARRGGEAS
jgi:hypothetical protein